MGRSRREQDPVKEPERWIRALEAKISAAVVAFERAYMGQSARRVSAYVVRDLVVIRSVEILSPAERQLAREPEGRLLLTQLRVKEMEGLRARLRFVLQSVIPVPIAGLNVDVSLEDDERVILCRLQESLEESE